MRRTILPILAFPLLALVACGDSPGAKSPERPALADKWFTRAQSSYRTGDFDDARDAVKSALQAAPNDLEVRLLGARIALGRLDYEEAIKLTEGLTSSDARGVRGRAFWYRGDLDQAAEELETMLQDPNVKDPWAREVSGLARRGTGRHPFEVQDGVIGAIEIPSAAAAGPAIIVPCELEGEQVLALVATATGEVVVDSSSRREAAWVNMRFGDHMEVKDVPALTQDLSSISHTLGAPIKALLGVNFLRHVHATIDRRGDQFVVRKDEPAAPPEAIRVPLWYVRGGGMIVRAGVSQTDKSAFIVDTSAMFPIALDDSAWKRAGVDLGTLTPVPGADGVKEGRLPMFRFAGFDLPQIMAVAGAPVNDLRTNLDLDLGGIIGAQLLDLFRVTFGDEGRFMWLEADPSLLAPTGTGRPGAAPPPPPSAPPAPTGPRLTPPKGMNFSSGGGKP